MIRAHQHILNEPSELVVTSNHFDSITDRNIFYQIFALVKDPRVSTVCKIWNDFNSSPNTYFLILSDYKQQKCLDYFTCNIPLVIHENTILLQINNNEIIDKVKRIFSSISFLMADNNLQSISNLCPRHLSYQMSDSTKFLTPLDIAPISQRIDDICFINFFHTILPNVLENDDLPRKMSTKMFKFWNDPSIQDLDFKLKADKLRLCMKTFANELATVDNLVFKRNISQISPEIALFKNLKSLMLKSLGRVYITPEIGKLLELKDLYINCKVDELPDAFSELKQLKNLKINSKSLKSFPSSIPQLLNLHTLKLRNIKVEALGKEVENLVNLKKLSIKTWLAKKDSLQLPMDSIVKLTNLVGLTLETDILKKIPLTISNLINLSKLKLQGNKIKKLPKSIGKLTNLTKLDLTDNYLNKIPKQIGDLQNLQTLLVPNNILQDLPKTLGNLKNLEFLDLSSRSRINALTDLKNCLEEIEGFPNEQVEEILLMDSDQIVPNNLELPYSLTASIENCIQALLKDPLKSKNYSYAKRLWKLFCLNSGISKLPESMGNLTKLQSLGLAYNKLRSLPISLKDIVEGLDDDHFQIADNPVSSLPKEEWWS